MSNLYPLLLFIIGFPLLVFATPEKDIDEQVPAALKILKAWEDLEPEKQTRYFHVVYWTPADREPAKDFRPRLDRMLTHIQNYYANEMERIGFGRRTMQLQKNADGKLLIHLVRGKAPYANYDVKSGHKIRGECLPTLKAAGIDPQHETLVIFCNMADWDEEQRTLRHRSPYYAGGTARSGNAWQLDSPILDTLHLKNKGNKLHDGQYGHISLGKHNTIFIGGIAHELGHSLGLPHNRQRPDEQAAFGTALMGSGNRTYGEELRGEGKGSFLTLAHALRLASHPQFSGSVKQLSKRPTMTLHDKMIKAEGKSLVVSGRVESEIPVYAMVAYTDPEGGGDYDATTASAVPDAEGRFVLHCTALKPGKDAKLKLVACFVNGATSGDVYGRSANTYAYTVGKDGVPDIASVKQRLSLEPLVAAVNRRDPAALKHAMQFLKASEPDAHTEEIARRLLKTIQPNNERLAATKVPAETTSINLSDLQPEYATVGWQKPVYGRVPHPDTLFEVGGKIFSSGIYAHAPAMHRYRLNGAWSMLTGKCGVFDRNDGSVVFVIKGDGKELYRTGMTRNGAIKAFRVKLDGIDTLELVVQDGGNGKHSDWGLWLDPMLSR